MRVALLTGIWPPDVGGPATHGPDFARFLPRVAITSRLSRWPTASPPTGPCPFTPSAASCRSPSATPLWPPRARDSHATRDVIYATATYAAAAAASTLARTPLVAKLVSDPAYERARRYGFFTGSLEAFQPARGPKVEVLKRLRTLALRRAERVVVPSRYLAGIATAWGLSPGRIEVLVNPAPPPPDVAAEALQPGTFVFVGRLTEQKALPVLSTPWKTSRARRS